MRHIRPRITLAMSLLLVACMAGCQRSEESISMLPEQNKASLQDTAIIESPDTVCKTTAKVGNRLPDKRVRAIKGDALRIETDGMSLTALGGAVKHSGVYSVTALTEHELPPMPQGMVNMTATTAGYRLLPSGDHFDPPAELRVQYDPSLLPPGYTPDDIYTSFFDSTSMSWVRLERIGIDTAAREIVSLTTHFTDFVNELLKAPEMPETQAFVPTAISSLEAANPMEGITLMQPPTASQDGSLSLSYPLDIPAGRNGMQPSLALTYNSGGGNGWLGEGWDIPIPSITIDTRWGVPRYDSEKESEVYMYKGEQLVAKDVEGNFHLPPHRTMDWSDRLPDGTRFFPRVDEAFDSIVRHGTKPSDYWWEVYDRSGTVHRYGRYETLDNDSNQSTLRDYRGNIARWCLTESEDAYGNMVRYLYDTVMYTGIDGGTVKGRQIYPAEIHYTLHRGSDGTIDDTGYHRVEFFREDDDRSRRHSHVMYETCSSNCPGYIPATISGRNGFKEVTASLLSHVKASSGDTMNSLYYFGMRMGRSTNYKVILDNVSFSKGDGETHYDEKGVFDRGYHAGNWLTFDYIPFNAEDEIFGPRVNMDDNPEWSEYGSDVNKVDLIPNRSLDFAR